MTLILTLTLIITLTTTLVNLLFRFLDCLNHGFEERFEVGRVSDLGWDPHPWSGLGWDYQENTLGCGGMRPYVPHTCMQGRVVRHAVQ